MGEWWKRNRKAFFLVVAVLNLPAFILAAANSNWLEALFATLVGGLCVWSAHNPPPWCK